MSNELRVPDPLLAKSLSDSEVLAVEENDSGDFELSVEEMSANSARAGDKIWLILVQAPVLPVQVSLSADNQTVVAENVCERDKLITFTVPHMPACEDPIQLRLSSGTSQVALPFDVLDRPTLKPALSLDNLMEFASSGDTLPLVQPYATMIGQSDCDGNTALHVAARNSQSYALKSMLSTIPELTKREIVNQQNSRGQTALHCAIRAGDPDSVHYLIHHGADPSISDSHMNTAIHYLADAYNEAIFKEILEPTSDVEIPIEQQNDEGQTALHLAVRRLKLSLVEMLLENGADLNSRDKEGRTAVMHAVVMNDTELVQYLVQRGADLNVEDATGATALLLARQNANYVIIGFLLDGGADPQLKNSRGEALVDWDDETVKRVISGERLTPPPKDLEWIAPTDLAATREPLFGRSRRDPDDSAVSRRLILRPPTEIADENEERENDSEQPSSSTPSDRRPIHQLVDEVEELLIDSDRPSTSGGSTFRSNRSKAFCKDDISCLDYLTRLRLSKILDEDSRWQSLARELECEHMVELISICSDDDSSPSMILLDQFEQLPDAKISRVREALDRLALPQAVALIDQRMVF